MEAGAYSHPTGIVNPKKLTAFATLSLLLHWVKDRTWSISCATVANARRFVGHVLLFLLGHYGFLWLFPTASPISFLPAFALSGAYTMAVAWSAALACAWMDANPTVMVRHRGKKLKPPPHLKNFREPSFLEAAPVALRNLLCIFATVFAVGWQMQHRFVRNVHESLFNSIVWFFVHLCTADALTYVGHVVMHKVAQFRHLHTLHHTSMALTGICGYYMSIVDAFLEHGTFFVSFLLWGQIGPAWTALAGVGAFNIIMSHSGWVHPWLPDPRIHWLHHVKYLVNYGVFMDYVFQTYEDPTERVEALARLGEKAHPSSASLMGGEGSSQTTQEEKVQGMS